MNPLDPTTTAKLLALPSLREQAEAEALEYHKSWVLLSPVGGCSWDGIDEWNRDALIAASVALLADLTRWQSQAWALREIGRLAGFKTISDSVPTIRVIPDEKRAILVVECGPEAMCFNLPEITTRPAALAAILLHLSESR